MDDRKFPFTNKDAALMALDTLNALLARQSLLQGLRKRVRVFVQKQFNAFDLASK